MHGVTRLTPTRSRPAPDDRSSAPAFSPKTFSGRAQAVPRPASTIPSPSSRINRTEQERLEETEALVYRIEKLQHQLRQTRTALEEEKQIRLRQEITTEIIQQELVTTVQDLKAERDRNAQLQMNASTMRSGADTRLQKQLEEAQLRCTQLQAELAMQRLQSTKTPPPSMCSRCDSTQRQLARASSGGDVATQVIADLLKSRSALDRVVELVLFGASPPPGVDAVIKRLLNSETVHTGSNADVLSLIERVKREHESTVSSTPTRAAADVPTRTASTTPAAGASNATATATATANQHVSSPLDPEAPLASVAERLQRIRLAREKFRNARSMA